MKKILFAIGCCLVLTLLAACDVEYSSYGDLYGFWHLESIDSIGNGGHVDMKGQRKFWAVQSSLVEMSDHDGVYNPVIFHFERVGDSLFLYDAHFNNREKGDPAVDDTWRVEVFGVGSLAPRLRIDRLSGSSLTLSTREVHLKLKKF